MAHYEIRCGTKLGSDISPDFLGKIAVDYVRHELLGYDAALRANASRGSKAQKDKLMKEMALAIMAAKYPWKWFTDECERQKG